MKPPGSDAPLVLVKWYAYAKWVLERVESFPKSQRFILGQRLSNHVMDVLETLVIPNNIGFRVARSLRVHAFPSVRSWRRIPAAMRCRVQGPEGGRERCHASVE